MPQPAILQLHGLTLNNMGGSSVVTDIKAVTLYRDINQNQRITARDIQSRNVYTFKTDNDSAYIILPDIYQL